MLSIKFMSHTLNNCGADYTEKGVKYNRIEGPNAKRVYNMINGLFSSLGEGTNLAWSSKAKSSLPSVSPAHWWSREEFREYLLPYLKFDTVVDDSLWFDMWVQKRVAKLRSEKKTMGSLLTKLEQMFVPGTSGHDPKVLVTAYIKIATVVVRRGLESERFWQEELS